MTRQWHICGVTLRGPAHVRDGKPNQDSFMKFTRRNAGPVVIVADGVGSCPTSQQGSRAACRAVASATRKWHTMTGNSQALVREIERQWSHLLFPFAPGASATTCLFAFFAHNQNLLLGMLGDGMISVLKTDGSYMELSEDKHNAFANQTTALGSVPTIEQWQTVMLAQNECAAVLLCTDGVAGDLLPQAHEGFTRHLYEQVHCQGPHCPSPATVTRALRDMLNTWPVPGHSDDKTIAFAYAAREVDA